MLTEKVSYLHRSYQSSLSTRDSLVTEMSVLREWIDKVKPTLSAFQLPTTNLAIQQLQDLLANHKVCKCIADTAISVHMLISSKCLKNKLI